MEQLTLIGLVSLIVAVGIREFFGWLRQKNLQNTETRLKAIEEHSKLAGKQIQDLHTWHDRFDEDGVPVWYIRSSLEKVVQQNAEAVILLAHQSQLTGQVLREIADGQKEIRDEIKRIRSSNGEVQPNG